MEGVILRGWVFSCGGLPFDARGFRVEGLGWKRKEEEAASTGLGRGVPAVLEIFPCSGIYKCSIC